MAFNNFVSVQDVLLLLRRIGEGRLGRLLSKITKSGRARVRSAWHHTTSQSIAWYDLPAVQRRRNVLISGDADVDHYRYFADKYLAGGQRLGLSLGCGTGAIEMRWAETGRFRRIDAYDLSESRIEAARSRAQQRGYGHILNFQVADVFTIPFDENSYDVVITEGSLHHFSPVEDIVLKIKRILKPDGYYVLNEFVGPTRFQWTGRQLDVMNALLSIFPAHYRRRQSDGRIKARCYRPSLLRMILNDPSEAVESSRILPLVEQHFELLELREVGETLLQALLNDIAHNFLGDGQDKARELEARELLQLCFDVEGFLLKTGDIRSDFVVAICCPKTV